MYRMMFAVLSILVCGHSVAAPPAVSVTDLPAAPDQLLLREVRYDGTLSDARAKFTVDVEAEAIGKGGATVTLFEGEVALLPAKLPPEMRIVRERDRYRLTASKPGRYKFRLELIAKMTRSELWNQVSFVGPVAGISSMSAAADSGSVEVQLLSGTAIEPETGSFARVRGVLGSDRVMALRWRARTAETARQALVTCETVASVRVSPTVIRYNTAFHYEIVQGSVARLTVLLPAGHALTRVEGEQIRDWQTMMQGDQQSLIVELIKPVEKSYALTIQSEQTVDGAPFNAQVSLPQPESIDRENGSLMIAAEDARLEIQSTSGLRQVNTSEGALACYRFHGRPVALNLALNRIEPVIDVSDRIIAKVEESRLMVTHRLSFDVEKASLYTIEMTHFENLVVTEVRGEGVEDWKVRDGRLLVSFSSRVSGKRQIEVQMEQPHRQFPEQVALTALQVTNARRQKAQVGVAPAAGVRVKTRELAGLREVPAAMLPDRTDELLGYVADQADWTLSLFTERLSPRIIADVFNLVTIGDGLVGGSATVRYVIVNQGVQEFELKVPAQWKNVEFTGPNIRRKELNGDVWTIALQDKAWGGYTLVVTYDEPFDPHQATLSLGGLHALKVEREAGSLAVTSAASLQLRENRTDPSLRRIDESELSETERAFINRSVLFAYRYDTPDALQLTIDVTRFGELPVLEAVADRTQLTTALTESGEMLTQAQFMVKNNDKQFQRFTLPPGATFWSAYVNGQPARAESDGGDLLVPLPRGANRDQNFAVEIVYAQKAGPLKSAWPHTVALVAPITDVQTTFAEWEVFIPPAYELGRFGGNMTVARGTTYGFGDAWSEFVDAYRSFWLNTRALLFGFVVILMTAALVVAAVRQGWHGALTVLATVMVVAVLAGMLLPALSRAKSKALRISAVNNLKQIGLAARIYAGDHEGKLPATLEQMRDELGSAAISVDPESGQHFVYLGAGRTEVDAASLLAYSPARGDKRSVLFADGSVQLLDNDQFNEALQRTANPAGSATAPGLIATAGIPAAASATGVGGGAPAGPQKAPMIQGIRPIRIDVPRMGERFVFTKVLNVSRNPLTFEAWAVTASTLHAVQSIFQVTAFVVGLLLVWRQLRRETAQSLPVAVGLSLILVSVGWLLITSRMLGMALIVVVPLTAFVLLVLLTRKYWSRRDDAASAERVVAGPTPPPLGGPAGAGAGISIVLLLLLTNIVHAEEIILPNQESKSNSPKVQTVSIESVTCNGVVKDRVASIEAIVQINASKAGEVVPLFGNDVAIETFSAVPADVRLIRSADGVNVRLPRKGSATLKVKFLRRLEGDVTRRHLAFAVPPSISSQLSLTLNEPEAAVEFPSAISYHSVASQHETRVEAILGALGRVDLSWTPRVKRAAETAATVFARNLSLVTVAEGAMQVRSTFDYQIAQGELREIRIQVPTGQRVLRVEGESIRTWQARDEDGKQVVTVELTSGVAPGYRLSTDTEIAIDKMPATLQVEVPHSLNVKRETGLIGLSSGDELGLMMEGVSGLQKVDAAEFVKASGRSNTLAGAYEYLKPEFSLPVKVETLRAEIEVSVRNQVLIGTEQIGLNAVIDYTIKRAGVFSLRLALPEGYRIEAVEGNEISQWTERVEDGSRTVDVSLKQRTLGSYTLQLRLAMAQTGLAKSLQIAGVQPLGAVKLNGFVIVSSEAGVQTRTTSFEGLTEIPAMSVPGGATGLAYKFLASGPASPSAPWNLMVTNEAIESWVRAEIANWITLSESLATGRAVVRFEIQNAPVKELRLKIPSAFRNVEITGADIRRRDQNGEEWRVELQNKVSGVCHLNISWEQPWSFGGQAVENVFQVEGIQAAGVERETGILAIAAKAPVQVAPGQAGSELIRVDTQEIPEWAGARSESAVLAYRYLRPGYRLSVAAHRFAQAEVLQALVDEARLTTVVADDGQMMTQLALSIRNNGRQFLEVSLPKGAQVWSAFVGGQAVKPSLRNDRLLLPLDRGNSDSIPVELIYVAAEPFPRVRGPVDLVSPSLDVPVKNARWELYLPPDYGYRGFGGTMTRELETAPVYASYSLSEYSQAETKIKQARESAALSSVNDVRSKLSSGKLEEASKAYNRMAARYGVLAEREEIKELEKDLRKAQSGNLLNAQQEVIANNSYFLQQSTDQQAKQLGVKFDDKTAGEQWVRLQRAQEVSTTTVRPLRVNLPVRGLRHSFSQVLQTEVGKAMRVSFVASNSRTPHWPIRIALGLLCFGFLWSAVVLVQNQRRSTRISAAGVA